jgi:ion channel
VGLLVGFALLQWASGSALTAPERIPDFGTDFYMSGTTFFTLGLGDVVPNTLLARAITVIEAGTGFGILALVIGYLPVLYQAFSRREVNISLLDARAGSPPSAGELLRRYGKNRDVEALNQFLYEWERWSAELLESHLSYPSMAYFRSQHDNQSWLAAMTMILDVCALVIVGVDGVPSQQAKLTFAMARHATVDLAQIFGASPHPCQTDRLPAPDLQRLQTMLAEAGVPLRDGSAAGKELSRWREMYEPFVNALGDQLLISLPPWMPEEGVQDDWLTSA